MTDNPITDHSSTNTDNPVEKHMQTHCVLHHDNGFGKAIKHTLEISRLSSVVDAFEMACILCHRADEEATKDETDPSVEDTRVMIANLTTKVD